MRKKVLMVVLVFGLVLPVALLILPVQAVDYSKVCGTDNITYDTAADAEMAGVDVSYGFACVDPTSEQGLYEAEADMNFAGQLVEVGSTDIPTTIIIRRNSDKQDFTIEVTANTILGQRRDQATLLSDWIPGDQIKVIGKQNTNTDTIEATMLINLSIKINVNRAANGWITAIDKDAKTITYQWANIEHTFTYDDNTKFVVGLKNPAGVDDLEINDRIRGRLLLRAGDTPLGKIVVVLRRGEELFMMIRTFRPNATLTRLDSTVIPTNIQVRIDPTPGLNANDVNNLIGTEGTLVTINITEDTKLVRKYFGKCTLDEFSVGDKLHIVGRVNNDGTVDAKMIKNNSIWKTSSNGYSGVVTEVSRDQSYIMVNWTPVAYLTNKKLKETLEASANTFSAQIVGGTKTRSAVKTAVADKVGQFIRNVQYKKIQIRRIMHSGLVLGVLINRKATKKIRVDISEGTMIVIGTNNNGTIADIQNGDKVRIRGAMHATMPIVVAETIVVVSSLPEIEKPVDTSLDDINSVVSEIVTDDTENAIVNDTITDTEEIINENGAVGDESIDDIEGDDTSATKEDSSADSGQGNDECTTVYTGYEYDSTSGSCIMGTITACLNPYTYISEASCLAANLVGEEESNEEPNGNSNNSDSCVSPHIICDNSCQTPLCTNDNNCDDNNTCTTDTCYGPGTCSANCSHSQITTCGSNDGCCPSGCTNQNDIDCTAIQDSISPQVTSFNVLKTNTTGSVSITYAVTDNISLDKVELWRAPDVSGLPDTWTKISSQNVTGTSATGSFSDTLPIGSWWYSVHVVDQAGNTGKEPTPPGPIKTMFIPIAQNNLNYSLVDQVFPADFYPGLHVRTGNMVIESGTQIPELISFADRTRATIVLNKSTPGNFNFVQDDTALEWNKWQNGQITDMQFLDTDQDGDDDYLFVLVDSENVLLRQDRLYSITSNGQGGYKFTEVIDGLPLETNSIFVPGHGGMVAQATRNLDSSGSLYIVIGGGEFLSKEGFLLNPLKWLALREPLRILKFTGIASKPYFSVVPNLPAYKSIMTDVKIIDANNDGLGDILVTAYPQDQHGAVLYMNQGEDSQGNPVFAVDQTAFPDTLDMVIFGSTIGDYDKDGDEDLMLFKSQGVAVYTNNEGVFTEVPGAIVWQSYHKSGVRKTFDVIPLDKDMDGRPEYIVAGAQWPYILENNTPANGTISFTEKNLSRTDNAFTQTYTSLGVAVSDFDRDGFEDFVFSDSVEQNRLWRGGANLTPLEDVTNSSIPAGGSMSTRFIKGDIDLNGFEDIIAINADFQPDIYLNDGSGNKVTDGSYLFLDEFSSDRAGWDGVLKDLNNDGRLDLVIAGSVGWGGAALNSLYHWEAGGFRYKADGLPSVKYSTRGVVASDLNNDGYDDLVFANTSNPAINIYFNCQRNGQWGYFTQCDSGVKGPININAPSLSSYQTVNLIEYDDGSPADIIAGGANLSAKAVVDIYRNNGNGDFIGPEAVAGLDVVGVVSRFIPINLDEPLQNPSSKTYRDDFLVAMKSGSNFLLINDGSGHFTYNSNRIQPLETSIDTYGGMAGDLNNDGWDDVIIHPFNSGGMRVYFNTDNAGTRVFQENTGTEADIFASYKNVDSGYDIMIIDLDKVFPYEIFMANDGQNRLFVSQ